jgi:hypothetical protein
MDVLAIILACSLHPDDALVRALARIRSNDNVYFVGDLATLKTRDGLTTAADALRVAQELERQGGRPAVGLLGVPLEWAARYGRAPIELFDACTNVALATSAFTEYAQRCAPHPRATYGVRSKRSRRGREVRSAQAARACILSRFAKDLGLLSTPAAILRSLSPEAEVAPGDADDGPAQRSQVFGGVDVTSASGAHASAPRLFFGAAPPAPSR